MEAVVLRSTGSFYTVRTMTGNIMECTLRGKFRLENQSVTNPIAVGDHVILLEDSQGASIEEILPRKNFLQRKSTRSNAYNQILCANIDQAMIIATLQEPHTPIGYLDRFLVMAEVFEIPAVIIFNKLDKVKKEKDIQKLADFTETYQEAGYLVHAVNGLDAEFQQLMQNLFKDKITFLSGLSGAGKSTLLNLVDPSLQLKTGEISKVTKKGRHTTTFAQMHPLACGGAVIDAPGFKEFEITDIAYDELSYFFPEMKSRFQACKFNNCTHTSEPGCHIKTCVETGSISHTRYNTYLSMLESIENETPRYS